MKKYLLFICMLSFLVLTWAGFGFSQTLEPEMEPMLPNLGITVIAKLSLDGTVLTSADSTISIKFYDASGNLVEPEDSCITFGCKGGTPCICFQLRYPYKRHFR